jgi:hypothetical protein
MLREYIKNIRAIKEGDGEKSSENDSIKFQEEAQRLHEPKQHPLKVISVFIAGLVLVILISSFFYYRTGKEGTKPVKSVQKQAIPFQQR